MEKDKLLKTLRIASILLIGFLGIQIALDAKHLGDTPGVFNSIAVSGEGEAVAVPNIATFSFSVSADSSTVSDAQAQVAKKTDAIVAKLKALQIDEKDIQTSDYSVYPKYEYSQAAPAIYPPPPVNQKQVGYTANNTITVKVRNTQNAGQALAAAGDNGATNISGISFTLDDPSAVAEQARARAIKNAKDKAKTLAKDLGVHLVRVVSFTDSSGGYPVPMSADAYGGGVAASKAPTVQIGSNTVKSTVNITYEIR